MLFDQQPCLEITARVQRLYLRNLPSVDKVGGPADGMTCIVTGPTRLVTSACALALLLCSCSPCSSQAPPARVLTPVRAWHGGSGIGRETAAALVRRRAHGAARTAGLEPCRACAAPRPSWTLQGWRCALTCLHCANSNSQRHERHKCICRELYAGGNLHEVLRRWQCYARGFQRCLLDPRTARVSQL